MNPANDDQRPYAELVKDTRHRWSWIFWDANDDAQAMSAVTFDTSREAAEHLKETRRTLPEAPVIFYTERKRARSGRYTDKHIDAL